MPSINFPEQDLRFVGRDLTKTDIFLVRLGYFALNGAPADKTEDFDQCVHWLELASGCECDDAQAVVETLKQIFDVDEELNG